MSDSLVLHVDPPAEVLAATSACELRVFVDRFDIEEDSHLEWQRRYDPHSVWLSVSRGQEVIGGARLLRPNSFGFDTFELISHEPWFADGEAIGRAAGLDPDRTWDVASLFRRTGGDGPAVTAALCYGIIQLITHNGGDALTAVMDRTLRILLERTLAIRTHLLPGTNGGRCWGTLKDPVFAFMSDLLDDALRRSPEAHRLLRNGAGLGDIDVPAPEDFALEPVLRLTAARWVPAPVLDEIRLPAPRDRAVSVVDEFERKQ